MTLIYDRVYKLEVGGETELLTVDGFKDSPAQIVFRVTRGVNSYIALANIEVYGLNADTRRKIYEEFRSVKLIAGYRDDYGEIFNGTIYNVGIGRDGPETFISLFCRSANENWLRSYINQAFGPRTPRIDIIRAVAATFGVPVEIIGDFSELPPASDGLTLSGDSKAVLSQMGRSFAFTWELEADAVIITKFGAVRENSVSTISAATGMVGSPQVRERGVDVTTKLRANIRNHDTVNIINETADIVFNNPNAVRYTDTIGKGRYQVWGITHSGDFYGDVWDTLIEGHSPRVGRIS